MFSSMPLSKKIALIFCLSLLAAAIWVFFFRTEEDDVIRRRVRNLAATASYTRASDTSNTSSPLNLKSVATSHAVGDYIAESASFQVNVFHPNPGEYDYNLNSRSEIVSTYLAARHTLSSLSFSISDISVEYTDESHRSARVNFIVSCKGKVSDGNDFKEIRAVSSTMVLEEEDGMWRFTSAQADSLPQSHAIQELTEE